MECAAPHDEEAIAALLGGDRKSEGRYFTPKPLVDLVLDSVHGIVPAGGGFAIIDPACGAGAFLAAAATRWPAARLWGVDLSEAALRICKARVPRAELRLGDALREGVPAPAADFTLWLGNPPYNGTSAKLREPKVYRELQSLLAAELPRGTSLRDDFVFFTLLAARHLRNAAGALAFITSATLLDAFLYGPVRRALLDVLKLVEVIDLGSGAFAGTRVRTCVTIWQTAGSPEPLYRKRGEPARPFRPTGPDWLLRPADPEAACLDAQWREAGEPLSQLVPVSFPGLKTRFEELLVDDDLAALTERMQAFLSGMPLNQFARRWRIPERCLSKLAALPRNFGFDPARIRPFFRYAGARHRGAIPPQARAHVYLDRRLIPRGDHRLRGSYDPHAHPFKLVFNARELPLSAAVLDQPGCVHDHRHARFAPLYISDAPNLSARGRAWAATLGGPEAAFRAIADFINSDAVQRAWAPSFGASRELCVPLREA